MMLRLKRAHYVNAIRAVLIGILILTSGVIVTGYENRYELQGFNKTVEVGQNIAEPANHTTVIGTQGTGNTKEWVQRAGDTPGEIIALDRSGDLIYYNNTYQAYWDIDPAMSDEYDVLYVSSEFKTAKKCGASSSCFVNHIELVNFTTGGTHRLYSKTVRNEPSVRWHDVERYSYETLLVADIAEDRIFIVNTTTGIITWEWEMESAYPVSYGGAFPSDWSHMNDVEVLPDGRIMVSLRNQDSVVFIDKDTGIQRNWTLGSNDAHTILHEQHNPDYIPKEHGGPAILVSDSENDRIVEYQREKGTWKRTWVWQSTKVNWPRDADRLPNGHTLITSTNSDRIIEINRGGDIVWTFSVKRPYEAERLGTGAESTGGESAKQLGLKSQSASQASSGSVRGWRTIVPEEVIRAVNFVRPRWMKLKHIIAVIGLIISLILWGTIEYYWLPYKISFQSPFKIRTD